MARQLTVVHDQKEIPLEVLADNIVKLAEVGKALSASRLKQRTIIMILHDATGVNKRDIESVLDALPELAKRYLK